MGATVLSTMVSLSIIVAAIHFINGQIFEIGRISNLFRRRVAYFFQKQQETAEGRIKACFLAKRVVLHPCGNSPYRTVKAQISKLEEDRSVFGQKIRQADCFSQLIEEYSDITELTSELLHTLIDQVVVHEKEEIDGEVVMRFDIYYRFIGRVGDANGDDTVIRPTKNAVTMYKNRVLG